MNKRTQIIKFIERVLAKEELIMKEELICKVMYAFSCSRRIGLECVNAVCIGSGRYEIKINGKLKWISLK